MSEMKSLQITIPEAKETMPWLFDEKTGKPKEFSKIPKFPEGISLNLDNTILKKLGMKSGDFELGQEVKVAIKGVVEKVFNEERLGEKPEMRVVIQPVEMSMDEGDVPLKEQLFKDESV